MRKMTEDNLKSAFAGESQAHMRYLIFSTVAKEEGRQNLSRLFQAIALAEQVHATNHLKALAGVGQSAENLDVAIGGETYEVEEMYPAFLAVAELQGESGARKSNNYALQAEKVHAAMYQEAKQAILEGKDISIGPIQICPDCGYTIAGEAPERCPICGAKGMKFRAF